MTNFLKCSRSTPFILPLLGAFISLLTYADYDANIEAAYARVGKYREWLQQHGSKPDYKYASKLVGDDLVKLNGSEPYAPKTDSDTCAPIDNRDASLAKIRNQDTSGWCGMYVAADLLEFKLKKSVSALDGAISYFAEKMQKNNKKLSEASLTTVMDVLSAFGTNGFCSESDVHSDDYAVRQWSSAGYQYPREYWLKNLLRETENIQSLWPNTEQYCKSISDSVLKMFPHLDIAAVLAILTTKSPNEYFPWLSFMECYNRREKLPELHLDLIHVDHIGHGQGGIPYIDEQLQDGNIVGMNFYDDFLFSPAHIEREKRLMREQGKDPNTWTSGGHSASIVGRRFNTRTGECEYLVRNSWGTGCDQYPSTVHCAEDNSGHFWMNETLLKQKLADIYYIK